MKKLAVLSFIFVISARADTIVTKKGEKFSDATVTRAEPDGLVVTHSSGVAKIPFTELSADLQKKYHYDAKEAQRFAAETGERQRALYLQTQEAKRRAAEGQGKAATASSRAFTEGRAPFDAEIQNAEKLLNEFYAKGHPKQRDQFETREEYEARLPKPFDSRKVLYFELTDEAGYSYDIDRQRLTLFGGEFKDPVYREYKLQGLTPLVIHNKLDQKGKYDASNAYGKSVKVTEAYSFHYVVHLTNAKSIPAQLIIPGKHSSEKSRQLSLSIAMPRDEAKETASHLALVCGARFADYKRSVMECTMHSEPTISSPMELAVFAYGADAELVSLHIVDKDSKQELSRWSQ